MGNFLSGWLSPAIPTDKYVTYVLKGSELPRTPLPRTPVNRWSTDAAESGYWHHDLALPVPTTERRK
jgi:hypothetical protein